MSLSARTQALLNQVLGDLTAGQQVADAVNSAPTLESGTSRLGRVLAVGERIRDTTRNQDFVGDGSTSGGQAAGYAWIPPALTSRAPSIVGGYIGNSVDATCISCTVLSGGQITFENKIFDAQLTGTPGYQTQWSLIVGGYDNRITSGYPSVIGGGAHNRINTATSPADAGNAGSAGAGTVSSVGTALTGSGTSFSSTLRQGSSITVTSGAASGQTRKITATPSTATAAVLESAFVPDLSAGTTYTILSYWITYDAYAPSVDCNHSGILSGTYNAIYGSSYATIGGGTQNTVGWDGLTLANAHWSFIGGGIRNVICAPYSNINGGRNNNITAGQYSTIGGGNNNTSSGQAAFTAGDGNTNASLGAVVFGQSNTVNTACDGNFVTGLSNTVTTGRYGVVNGRSNVALIAEHCDIGGREGRARNYGQMVRSAGMFSAAGDRQRSSFSMRWATTGATKTEIGITGGNVNTGSIVSFDRLYVNSTGANHTLFRFDLTVVAIQQATSNGAVWTFSGTVYRGASNATTIIWGGNIADTDPTSSNGTTTGWKVAVSADTTNGSLKIEVTGAAATNIRWGADIRASEIAYP
jgi:hypothetical protein